MSRRSPRRAEPTPRAQHCEHLPNMLVSGFVPYVYEPNMPAPATVSMRIGEGQVTVTSSLSPAEARALAASLIRCADFAEGVSAATPEAERAAAAEAGTP